MLLRVKLKSCYVSYDHGIAHLFFAWAVVLQ